jgi:hypothetical protein
MSNLMLLTRTNKNADGFGCFPKIESGKRGRPQIDWIGTAKALASGSEFVAEFGSDASATVSAIKLRNNLAQYNEDATLRKSAGLVKDQFIMLSVEGNIVTVSAPRPVKVEPKVKSEPKAKAPKAKKVADTVENDNAVSA